MLQADIRSLAGAANAEASESSPFGEFSIVRGELRGPNGTILKVRTVWIRLAATGETRFVTLVPDEELGHESRAVYGSRSDAGRPGTRPLPRRRGDGRGAPAGHSGQRRGRWIW